jgi:hypothetical protein
MLLQNESLIRTLSILIPMPFICIVFLYLAYKILRRSRSRISLTLSCFYILLGLSTLTNIVFLLLIPTEFDILLYILYFFIAFITIFGFVFILIFIHNLLNIESIYSFKKYLLVIIVYGLCCFILLGIFFFGVGIDPELRISISNETNWTPVYSIEFLIVVYIFFSLSITLPTLIYSIKLYNQFEDKNLKKKLRYFILGIFGMTVMLYGVVLFNTWQNITFKSIWSILVIFIMIPSAYSIYYGIGQNL